MDNERMEELEKIEAHGAENGWVAPMTEEDREFFAYFRSVFKRYNISPSKATRLEYRNVFSVVPKSKVKTVVKMLKAIHAQERKKASREKAKAVVAELRAMKLKESARKAEDGIEETLTYCDFPSEH